jgi:hypothetical protein
MWDESRALPAFNPARFAFAIRAVATYGFRGRSRLAQRRTGGAAARPALPHGRLHSIDNGEIGRLPRIASMIINSGALPRTEMPGFSRDGPLRSC